MTLMNSTNCPVCLVDGTGSGDYGNFTEPCRYPWQTPIGVLMNNVANPNVPSNNKVQESGTFTVPASDIAEFSYSMLGYRVYYNAANDKFCAENTGTYPGAATIGYVSDIQIDAALDRYVTITIDPRPATAQYRIANYSGSSGLTAGTPVTILADNTALSYSQSVHQSCDGIVAAMRGSDQVIVCVAGRAWIHPSEEQLYAVCNHDDIVESGFSPQNVPVDANLAFVPFDGGDVPRIGFVHWVKWYYIDDDPETVHDILIDVDPEYPTVGDYENANHASDGVIVAP